MDNTMGRQKELLGMKKIKSDINENCQTLPVARIAKDKEGRERIVPASNIDPTSPAFQKLFGQKGTVTNFLGIGSDTQLSSQINPPPLTPFDIPTINPPPLIPFDIPITTPVDIPIECPKGKKNCNPDPYFHFPDLQKDSGDCLYIPTFTDVPITISMATYFIQAVLKEISSDKILKDIDGELKNVFNKIVEGNLFFNYIPIAVIIIVLVWVMVIHGLFDWKAGLLLTFVFIAVFWLGYLLLDLTVRENVSTVATKSTSTLKNSFSLKNEDIIGNIIKGYYTALNHMILPEAAICKSSPTGSNSSCGCFTTSKTVTVNLQFPFGPTKLPIKVPLPAIIINDQIKTGGNLRCVGIDNNKTLLPTIDKLTPCIKDVKGFNLSNLTGEEKEKLASCALYSLPQKATQCSGNTKNTIDEKLLCLLGYCGNNPAEEEEALCKLFANILQCSLDDQS